MSDLATYKQLSKQITNAEKIKRLYKNLQTVKEDSKNVSTIVHRHIDKLLEPFNSSSSTPSSSVVNNITVKGNYYNIDHEDMKETEEVEFKQKWVEFLADAEQSKTFHNPEKNGVTRLGAKLSPYPNADKDTYRYLKK
ncbi:uncharacterized protein EV154DRAFT_569207 [Mucor mucedo]|uniref:uncharacterized protein n=1 Tax=Mucor mucedo TaxID=29922 RepID=UPI00221F33F1|nr:uncharacterized protein EV154DRAFT_569207 [Mucor mucedo]KAI7876469.1 hypothetical protein EV154DRAFT_569207 [Mucor mucedo]